jgi:hypothetical protein
MESIYTSCYKKCFSLCTLYRMRNRLTINQQSDTIHVLTLRNRFNTQISELGNDSKKVVDNKSNIMYNTCIDTEKSVMFFKNLLLRIFLALLSILQAQKPARGVM